MARKRKTQGRAFNIVTHPHDSDTYVRLFEIIWSLRYPVIVRGDDLIIMQSLRRVQDDENTILEGSFAKFTQIDISQPWFNLENLDKAEEEELREISIPEQIRPNFTPFDFYFFPKHHILVYESYFHGKTLSSLMLSRYLENIFAQPSIIEEFGEVSFSTIASEDSLNHVFGLELIRRISISFYRPNPDHLEDTEEKVRRRMERLRAQKEVREIQAGRGESFAPQDDEETMELAQVATHSGEVTAFGKESSGASVERSTKERPMVQVDRYDPDALTSRQAFRRLAERFLPN